MAEIKWMDTLVQVRRMYNLLGEVEDLSQQLAEAIDRDDQVTIQMLMTMREEPIQSLSETRQILKQQLSTMESQEADRLRALLNGAPAQEEAEKLLADQIAANDRLLKRILALDRVLNEKITREQSIYH